MENCTRSCVNTNVGSIFFTSIMKHITSINFDIPTHGKFNSFFNSKISLDDSDIVIFKPFDYYMGIEGQYQGKDNYDESSSNTIKEDTSYWRNELKSFIETGKNVFVITSKVYDFYVKTGKFTFSGTGRTARRTDYVEEYNNYNFLKNNDSKFTNANGNKFKIVDSSMTNFVKTFEQILSFQCYISNNSIKPLLTTKNGRENVSGIINYAKGNIIFLPNIDFDSLTTEKNGKEVWTTEAIKLGKNFLNFIVELDNQILDNQEKSVKPEWLLNEIYKLEIEKELLKKTETNTKKIANLLKENELLRLKIEDETVVKGLLYETGKPLEIALIKALELLGYSAENYTDARLELDAVILSPEGDRYIGECEGKDSKDVDISKFRQLNDSLAEDFEREEVIEKAKGIIFGNPQRLLDISERKLDFTLKCKNGAEREKIGLIRTADLFPICKYLMKVNDENFKIKCREAIKNQLGSIIQFPKVPN